MDNYVKPFEVDTITYQALQAIMKPLTTDNITTMYIKKSRLQVEWKSITVTCNYAYRFEVAQSTKLYIQRFNICSGFNVFNFWPLTYCGLVTSYGDNTWINIGWDNGLVPDNTKPLPKLILTIHQWGPAAFPRGQFHSKVSRSLARVWKILIWY